MSDLYSPCSSPVQNTEVGSLSLLQWIFLTEESTGVSFTADGFFTNWIIREALRMKGEFQSWPWECFWDLVVLLSQQWLVHKDFKWCLNALSFCFGQEIFFFLSFLNANITKWERQKKISEIFILSWRVFWKHGKKNSSPVRQGRGCRYQRLLKLITALALC